MAYGPKPHVSVGTWLTRDKNNNNMFNVMSVFEVEGQLYATWIFHRETCHSRVKIEELYTDFICKILDGDKPSDQLLSINEDMLWG